MSFDIPTPASGSYGTERVRLLQDRLVVLQHLAPNDAVERVAFSGDVAMVPLQQNMMYS